MIISRISSTTLAQASRHHGSISSTLAALSRNARTAAPKAAPCNGYLQGLQSEKNTTSCSDYYRYMQDIMTSTAPTAGAAGARAFSSVAAAAPHNHMTGTGTGTGTGRASASFSNLDDSTVAKIKQDFMAADTSRDGRLDYKEFKNLLTLHPRTFSEDEVERLGEVFYAGKAGESVSFDRFIEAIDAIAADADDKPTGQNRAAKKLGIGSCGAEYLVGSKPHAYAPEQLDVALTHKPPEGIVNRTSFAAVKGVRFLFDLGTGWNGEITAPKVLSRVIYLETIAAVPGMVAGIIRHFKSLRAMERDGGLLNMFLEEALNERMHLLTFVKMREPGFLFRLAVLTGQVGFGSFYLLAYMISPRFCHTFVGYVEEEACATYTKIIAAIEGAPAGTDLAAWRTEPAPAIGKSYWHLGESGTVLDLMYAVRADEAEHRDVNHIASDLRKGDIAPVGNPKKQVDMALRKYVKDLITV